MSLSPIGGPSTSLIQLFQDKRAAMKSMMSAVQSGDIKTAQADATQIQNDNSQISSAADPGSSPNAAGTFQSTVKTDMSNLLQAVQSGNLSNSQSALTQLQTDRSSFQDNASGSTSASPNAFLTNLQGLLSSLTSGNASGTQTAATALQSDLTSVLGSSSSSPSRTSTSSSTSGSGNFLTDLQSLISDAQSGNLSGAQTAAASMANDITSSLGSVSGSGHHHHHHMDADAAAMASPPTTPSASSSASSGNSIQNILALLASASQPATATTPVTSTSQSPAAQLMAA